jgi:phosphosulfolactate synthase
MRCLKVRQKISVIKIREMDLNLSLLPSRSPKPRSTGITMIQDEGLSLKSVDELISASGHLVDFVRFSYATLCSAEPLAKRVEKYRQSGILPLMSGIIFEAAYIRESVDNYLNMLGSSGIDHIEISDAVVEIFPGKKAEIIGKLSERFTVFSKTGTKVKTMSFGYNKWQEYITTAAAGSKKLIIEGGETGTSPVFSGKTGVNVNLVNHILKFAKIEDIIWETPSREQQVWFITRFGASVNLAGIDPLQVLSLESRRLGMSWETFGNNIHGIETDDKKLRKTDPIFDVDFQL